MKLESVQALKAELLSTVVQAMSFSTGPTGSARAAAAGALPGALAMEAAMVGVSASAFSELPKVNRSIALGISKKGKEHQLAIRVQRQQLLNSPLVEQLKQQAKGEVDIRLIGRLEKRTRGPRATTKVAAAASAAGLWHRSRVRPLQIGTSLGHFKVTAGTLGCFVVQKKKRFILSNNHVLANEDDATKGDDLLQPGKLDGGLRPADGVGKLDRWIHLKSTGANFVDAALGSINEPDDCDVGMLQGIYKGGHWKLGGVGPNFLDKDTLVYKVGRTTGATVGRVTAFELDNVVVQYDRGNLRFDNQVEIEGAEDAPFSAGGDSGSIIVNADRLAVALLFAGGDTGGSNGLGLTYANPIHRVLADLKVELVY